MSPLLLYDSVDLEKIGAFLFALFYTYFEDETPLGGMAPIFTHALVSKKDSKAKQ